MRSHSIGYLCSTHGTTSASEILCYDNYCALAVSIMGERLVCPEIAFERLGINRFDTYADKEKYRWVIYGDKLWREMKALKEDGWTWAEIGDYFGMSNNYAMTVYSRAKRKWGKKGAQNV